VIGGDLHHLDAARQRLYEDTRTVARERLAPIAAAGEPGRVNRALVQALADEGLLGRLFPAEGRTAVSLVELCVVREALASESPKAETAFALQGLGSFPILRGGVPETVAEWMPRVTAGTAVAAFALTEAAAGSDVRAMQLEARRDGSGWRLSGEKTFISNAPEADVYSVFARLADPPDERHAIAAFAVPAGSQGLSGESLSLIGDHPIGTLVFDDVPVGEENLLGAPGRGLALAMATLDVFRPTVGAGAVGMAQQALEQSVRYAAERQAFGRPLAGFQAVSHALADMATQTQAARLLVHHAAQVADSGNGPITQQAAMAKLMATESAQRVIDSAVQIHGATALRTDHPISHLYQDVRALRIYEGTSEIQREIIARGLQPRG
jgi:alkylation response protein AidB-like acyl-CoA dehydrogenase